MGKLDKSFWNNRYITDQTGWDIGAASLPLKNYFEQLEDKKASILIPGAGNAYELDELMRLGFANVTIVDIAPEIIKKLKTKYGEHPNCQIVEGDFFELTAKFDLIVEQTFFCALEPNRRAQYVDKMHELLKPDGMLVGVLFDQAFEDGPPFGGSKKEYEQLFQKKFAIKKMEKCYNSIPQRDGSELWICLKPKK